MKILSNERYEELLNSAGDLKSLETSNKKLKRELSDLEYKIEQNEKSHELESKERLYDKQREIDALESELDTKKAECDILNKAFENMGFDVKDMKEILGKLVDGIISKNEIKLINK